MLTDESGKMYNYRYYSSIVRMLVLLGDKLIME